MNTHKQIAGDYAPITLDENAALPNGTAYDPQDHIIMCNEFKPSSYVRVSDGEESISATCVGGFNQEQFPMFTALVSESVGERFPNADLLSFEEMDYSTELQINFYPGWKHE